MAGSRDGSADPLSSAAFGAILVGVILAFLYYGKDILIPVVLAVLLSFVLSPLVNWCRPYVPRTVAVALVVAATLIAVFLLGFALARQVIELGSDLPRYEATLRQKLKTFRTGTAQTSIVDKASSVLSGLSKELEPPQAAKPDDPNAPPQQKPIPVEIHQPPDRPLDVYQRIVTALLGPVTTTGIVLIMVIFILLQKNDIRDRVIRLAGTRDLQLTTAALNDAASRLSRLFLMQTALNASFGTTIAAGLWLIGVPSPILWGVFSGLMRFVPYIGSLLSAVFPLLLAVSVDPGWTMALATAALFLVLEPLTGNIIEPWLQGHSTGLSPLAIVVSAVLWTTLWGPIGLLIATPVTMCLVVLGRHIDGLSFLNVILGDEPVLTPEQMFYQRLLAGSSAEAAEHVEAFVKERSLLEYADTVALPGLQLAARDAERGVIDEVRMEEIFEGTKVLLDDLSDIPLVPDDVKPGGNLVDENRSEKELAAAQVAATKQPTPSAPFVLCLGARRPIDAAAAEILAFLLQRQGVATRAASIKRLMDINRIDFARIDLVWVSSLSLSSEHAQIRYVVRRLHRMSPHIAIFGGFWGMSEAPKGEFMPGIRGQAKDFRTAIQETIDFANQNFGEIKTPPHSTNDDHRRVAASTSSS